MSDTLKFADWTGESGCVIAVEPDHENFEALAAKIEAAGLQRRVRLVRAAAAAERGTIGFERNELYQLSRMRDAAEAVKRRSSRICEPVPTSMCCFSRY
jgi:FkbM family methyltransferase